jgi:hypothetical protein
MDEHNYLNIDDFISPKYKDKGGSKEPCFLCGRPVDHDKAKFIHLLTDGTIVDSDDNFGDRDQGSFPIGPECQKKLPKNFLI